MSIPTIYSQTGCFLDGNFGNSRRNIGIWLTVWVEQVAIRPSKFLSLSQRFQISFEEQFANQNSYCGLWWLSYNYYNRTTTLEKREKIITLCMSGSKQAQIAEEVGLCLKRYPILWTNSFIAGRISLESLAGRNEQFLPLKLLNL